ncbi:MAG TPA: tetratricopeptide repeat protein, partial [Pyrinomonadaceae bacterium]|nr:tetratricopeptide repeat protein [Pyrinomonadaceae bacterium]
MGVVDRQDLLFTQGEVEQLFAETFGQPINQELLSQLHERTNGWATGLQLIAQAVEHRSLSERGSGLTESALLETLKQSEDEIFDYFAEEVLQYETAETQEVLLRLSLFSRIDPVTAGCVLPPEEAYQLLASLQRRNLFISHVEGGGVDEYSFHPMFRRFLRRRLRARVGEAGLRDLNREYADRLMQLGNWQKAGLLYAEAHDTEAMAKIMVERGRELMDAGLFEIIKRGYQAVVEAVPKLHPEVLRLRAHIARMEGDLVLAERLFTKAVDGARAIDDARCQASSLHGLASTLIQRGEHARAFVLAREALAKAPTDDLTLQAHCEHTLGNCQFLTGVATGEFDEAIQTWQRGVELARRAGNDRLARIISHNIGLPYAFTGDIERAREWFSQLVDDDGHVAFPQEVPAYCNLARTDLARGEFDEAERHLEKAMERCRLFNLTFERAEAHEVIGNLHRERKQFGLARDHYSQAEDLYRDAHMPLDSRELPDEQVRLLLTEGNISKARDAAANLLEKRERLGYAVPLARSRLLLGRALLESHDRDAPADERKQSALTARGLLAQALSQFTACRSHALIASARLLLARAELDLGNEEEAAAHFTEAVRLAREFNYSYWLKTGAARWPEVFRAAFARKIEVDYLTSIGAWDWEPSIEGSEAGGKAAAAAASAGATASAQQTPAASSRPRAEAREYDLIINLLGPVEVLREQGRRLAADA